MMNRRGDPPLGPRRYTEGEIDERHLSRDLDRATRLINRVVDMLERWASEDGAVISPRTRELAEVLANGVSDESA